MSEQNNTANQTFDNFIVSRSNRKAYLACLDLVNNPQGKFIAIYGANSLGKTHLLYAVNNALINKKTGLKTLFTNYEYLISQYITALHKNEADTFSDRLLETDLLIVDNMQFVAGKEYTQEEIANWVNRMIFAEKTVVMAFDRPIKYYAALIKEIMDGNTGNCKVVEIKQPDYLLRKKYLKQLLNNHSINLPFAVKKYLVFSKKISFSAMNGFLYKYCLLEKQKGTKLTLAEMCNCLKMYIVNKAKD